MVMKAGQEEQIDDHMDAGLDNLNKEETNVLHNALRSTENFYLVQHHIRMTPG